MLGVLWLGNSGVGYMVFFVQGGSSFSQLARPGFVCSQNSRKGMEVVSVLVCANLVSGFFSCVWRFSDFVHFFFRDTSPTIRDIRCLSVSCLLASWLRLLVEFL